MLNHGKSFINDFSKKMNYEGNMTYFSEKNLDLKTSLYLCVGLLDKSYLVLISYSKVNSLGFSFSAFYCYFLAFFDPYLSLSYKFVMIFFLFFFFYFGIFLFFYFLFKFSVYIALLILKIKNL